MSYKNEKIKELVSLLPERPGVYQYFDKEGTIIYVGKAKNLKRRVSSYFTKEHDSVKTAVLVKQIVDLQYIVVNSEEDALHLENSLIKEHKPRYNVLLKDDKTYPWIVVCNEPFPRVMLTRNPKKNGSKYFGPYTNVHVAKTVLAVIRSIYPIRTCSHLLTPDNIKAGKFKQCLQYHIKNCHAPCVGYESEETYLGYIAQVKQILRGNTQELSQTLIAQMQAYAAELKFEEAQKVKEQYLLVEQYRAKSEVVSNTINEVDVYAYAEEESAAFVNYLHVRKGSIVQSFTIEYKKRMDEAPAAILSLAIVELRTRFGSTTREAIVPLLPDAEFADITFTIPQRGDKRKLLEISEQNVKQYKVDRLKQSEKLNPEQRTTRILTRLQKDFQLDELPMHIECFDNSNIQGTHAVASCVVFKKAKPAKKDYRHFNIKTVVGPDDYASMREIIYRRYKRLRDENEPLPQLVVIDGGKGQLSAAVSSLKELELLDKIAIVGIAKRLEEIFFPNDPIPLYLDKNSESLRLIQHMRDEAHRFGITHHRNKRSKGQVLSALDGIAGVGEKSRTELLKAFKSVKRIREASLEEIAAVVGETRAKRVVEALHPTEEK